MREFDVIVIGSGPGGEGAAMQLAKAGKRVAIVENYSQVGGGCVHWGTIPSKALRHLVELLAEYRHHPLFQHTVGQMDVSYPQLLQEALKVSGDQSSVKHRYYVRNQVDIIYGFATFVNSNQISVTRQDGREENLTAQHFIIATGSRPYQPADVDFNHQRVLDSHMVLELTESPKSITIYGAGVIGCEYASIFAKLDVKVNLVNTRDRLLSFLDTEITDALSYHLRDEGVLIRHNETFQSVDADDQGVTLTCQSGAQFRSDYFLWANGRSGNTHDMGLDEIGLTIDHRGHIEVDDMLRTSLPHIYAVGDVIGPPGLASASYDQGRFAGGHIAMGDCGWRLLDAMPTGIYTSPEISSLGKTEQELNAAGIGYEVGRAEFKNLARAQIDGKQVGVLKLLFDRDNLKILGIHCFGNKASEILHIGQAIMSQPGETNRISWFVETTFNYPTMAEAYRVAALNGLNRLC